MYLVPVLTLPVFETLTSWVNTVSYLKLVKFFKKNICGFNSLYIFATQSETEQ